MIERRRFEKFYKKSKLFVDKFLKKHYLIVRFDQNFEIIDSMARFPSGQRGQTVNLLALPSKVRILLSPPFSLSEGANPYSIHLNMVVAQLNEKIGCAKMVQKLYKFVEFYS